MAMRLIYFEGFSAGIGGAVLFFALWLQHLVVYFASFVFLFVTLLVAILNTFFNESGIVGSVHPDELLFGNIFAFLFVIAEILVAGYFMSLGTLATLPYTDQYSSVQAMFNYASVIFVVFILLWTLEFLKGIGVKSSKETMASLILYSLVLGFIVSAILAGFNQLFFTYGFNTSASILGGVATITLFVLGIVFRFKYEEQLAA